MTQQTGFRCEACGAEFPSQEALKSHAQQAHGAQSELRCPACGAAFPSQQELQEHARREHAA